MGNATRFLTLLTTTTTTSSPLLTHRCSSSLLRLSRHHHRYVTSSISSLSIYQRRHHHPSTSRSHPLPLKLSHDSPARQLHTQAASSISPPPSHPWPEWSHLLNTLTSSGYFNTQRFPSHFNSYVDASHLPEDFLRAADACLAYASDRPDILRMVSSRDIEVVVRNGSPYLFKNGDESMRKMTLFLDVSTSHVQNTDGAQTIDLMRFLLSYASNLICSERNNIHNQELVEPAVRNLMRELAQLCYNSSESSLSGSVQKQFVDKFGQTPRPLGRNVEMKRGDWICPRCSFMNFARNMDCLECSEARPKMQLTGGEWECPQCDFFNYGRNVACLRCDCKRPGDISLSSTNSRSVLGYGNGSYANNANIDAKLAANEEKAQRWFSKVSQMDSTSDIGSAVADEDFPEIMPLRKGVNRFVVSTRKTPLERRLANAQYERNSGTDGSTKDSQTLNRSLDEILGHKSAVSELDGKPAGSGQETGTRSASPVSSSPSPQFGAAVDLPVSNVNEKEQAEKTERWFKRVAELHNVSDLGSAIPDDDFPEIMPMRKGENRFVVSKKKDRSLTSPMYKKRMSMEQANNPNYVPFVPFPPNYFARKENEQPDRSDSPLNTMDKTSSSELSEKPPQKLDDDTSVVPNATHVEGKETQGYNAGTWNSRSYGENSNETRESVASRGTTSRGNSTQNFINSEPVGRHSWSDRHPMNENASGTPNTMGNSTQAFRNAQTNISGTTSQSSDAQNVMGTTSQSSSDYQNIRDSWRGKSLEGSAVKEPDPLDMSEEAKAERWFRRVAQIKDISELSQIPDEDFPSIMPMRKGVNRFVVSKRKTPLERRLTSPQYRRNLPVVSSDSVKDNENS